MWQKYYKTPQKEPPWEPGGRPHTSRHITMIIVFTVTIVIIVTIVNIVTIVIIVTIVNTTIAITRHH